MSLVLLVPVLVASGYHNLPPEGRGGGQLAGMPADDSPEAVLRKKLGEEALARAKERGDRAARDLDVANPFPEDKGVLLRDRIQTDPATGQFTVVDSTKPQTPEFDRLVAERGQKEMRKTAQRVNALADRQAAVEEDRGRERLWVYGIGAAVVAIMIAWGVWSRGRASTGTPPPSR